MKLYCVVECVCIGVGVYSTNYCIQKLSVMSFSLSITGPRLLQSWGSHTQALGDLPLPVANLQIPNPCESTLIGSWLIG